MNTIFVDYFSWESFYWQNNIICWLEFDWLCNNWGCLFYIVIPFVYVLYTGEFGAVCDIYGL